MTAKTALVSQFRVDPPGLNVVLRNRYQVENRMVKMKNDLEIALLNSSSSLINLPNFAILQNTLQIHILKK